MTFNWEFNTTTILALGLQTVAFIVFLFKTHFMATAAAKAAGEAHDKIEKLEMSFNGAIITLTASIALVREQYVDKDSLRDMEGRITDAIKELGRRFDTAIMRREPGP